jgi:tetratricopeptide (TPR) repeat protein
MSHYGSYVRWGFLDFQGAAPEIERAQALAPGSAQVEEAFGGFSSWLGHHRVAIEAMRHLVALDPQSYRSRNNLAVVLSFARRFDQALAVAEEVKVLNREGRDVEEAIWFSELGRGRADRARELCISPATPLEEAGRHLCLAFAYHVLGNRQEALDQLNAAMSIAGDSKAYRYAEVYSQWGDNKAALGWLEKAVKLNDPAIQVIRVDWALDPIRNLSEFKTLERRLNLGRPGPATPRHPARLPFSAISLSVMARMTA